MFNLQLFLKLLSLQKVELSLKTQFRHLKIFSDHSKMIPLVLFIVDFVDKLLSFNLELRSVALRLHQSCLPLLLILSEHVSGQPVHRLLNPIELLCMFDIAVKMIEVPLLVY